MTKKRPGGDLGAGGQQQRLGVQPHDTTKTAPAQPDPAGLLSQAQGALAAGHLVTAFVYATQAAAHLDQMTGGAR